MKLLSSFIQRRNIFTCKLYLHSTIPRFILCRRSHELCTYPSYPLLGFCKDIDSLQKVHALLIVRGLTGNLLLDTKLVSLYGSFGRVSVARLLFDGMPDPDFYSWKVLLRWYSLNGCYLEIVPFYNCMRVCVTGHDDVVLSIMLKACSELRDIAEGRKVHCHAVKGGSSDSFVFSGLVDMYAKCGEIECSRRMFDEIVDKNVVLWTSMIAGYVQNDFPEEGLVLFNLMRKAAVDGNQFTLGSLVTACTKLGALHQGRWFHGYIIKKGSELNSFLVTALIDFYVKCGEVADARHVFDELSTLDLVSWTAMIVGYTQNGFPTMALALFADKKRGLIPNSITVASVLSACAHSGDLDMGKLVHGLEIKLGLEEPAVRNALLDMYAKCQKMVDAQLIFESVPKKDVIAWNSVISGFLQNGSADRALELFHCMRLDSVAPDAVTLVLLLSASALLGSFRVGSSLHGYSIKEGLLSNVYVGTALLNFYAKCGDTESARVVFDGMGIKNTITWGAMIGGYGIQGNGTGSLALFNDMLKEELKPTEVIFTTILSACRHTGMVDEGWRYFNSMCEDYKFVPQMKHYACMVDLLSRAGRLEEALEFMEKMPVQPEVSLFAAFLHGCGLYSRFDLGEIAIKKMLELHPGEACYYVLVSNLYASDGRWSQVNKVRELMEQRGLKKDPACSAVEMEADADFSLGSAAAVY